MAKNKGLNIVDLATARQRRSMDSGTGAGASGAGPSAAEPYSELIDRIYRDHNEALVRFLYAKLRSVQDAQEVAQEAYVRVLRLDEPEAVKHLQSYLFRTAANLAVDRLRRNRRRPTFQILETNAAEASSTEPQQDAVLEGRQKLSLIKEAVADLPPKCRKAFMLYKFEAWSYAEIALDMALSESMIRKCVIRALVYCRERLGDEL